MNRILDQDLCDELLIDMRTSLKDISLPIIEPILVKHIKHELNINILEHIQICGIIKYNIDSNKYATFFLHVFSGRYLCGYHMKDGWAYTTCAKTHYDSFFDKSSNI